MVVEGPRGGWAAPERHAPVAVRPIARAAAHRLFPTTDSIYSKEVVLRDGAVSYQGLTQYKLATESVRLFARMLLKRRVFAILSVTQPDQQTLRQVNCV